MQGDVRPTSNLGQRAAVGALVFLLLLLAGIRAANAGEIVPSIGIAHSVAADENRTMLGLELRGNLAPMVKTGIGVGYRSEDAFDGALTVRTIPVTASLWLSPLPTLYAGGGAGMYFTTLSFGDAIALPDQSDEQFGWHLGGGMNVPLGPVAALDLHGRYVFLQDEVGAPQTGTFDPDFWMASAGVAIRF
uniref:Porin family protein n=1 Tax=Eiseniibacteriota bacterium TaxID=2212470 RepID=A0A832IAN1_UNCEI